MINTTKLFGLTALLFFAVIAITGFASAASLTVSNISYPTTLTHNQGSFPISFDITNAGAADSAISFMLQMSSGTANLVMPNVPIGDGTTTPVTIHVSGTVNYPSYQYGNLIGKVVVDDQGGGSAKYVDFNSAITNAPGISVSKKEDITATRNGSIEVSNTGNVPWTNVQLSDSGTLNVDFYDASGNKVTSISLTGNQKKTLTVAPTNLGEVGFEGKSVSITATADDTTTKSTTSMSVSGSFCKYGEVGGDLEIRNIKITNNGQGKKDEWDLLDSVSIEVEVENVGDDKVKDILVEMGLFNSEGRNVVSDLEFDSKDDEQADLGTLNDGDKDTVTYTFKVPADFDDGTYKLTLKAYSDDVGEDEQCVDTSSDFSENDKYDSIDVNREDDDGKYFAFDNVQFTPNEGTCGDSVTMTADVYNIGDEDQEQVRINLKNTDLKIDSFVEIRSGMDQGDKQTVSFTFAIPQDASDKFYNLALSADYDYRSGNYRQSSDSDTLIQYRLIGCGSGTDTNNNGGGSGGTKIATISASLESEQVSAGGEVTVRATITNLKSQRTVFAVDALGYQSWATLGEVSPRVVDLGPGESKDVLLTFTVDDNVQGEQSFEVEAKDGLGGSETREIALNVSGASAGGSTNGFFDLGNNTFLWIIGAVNVILVVLIIVVAVRVARR